MATKKRRKKYKNKSSHPGLVKIIRSMMPGDVLNILAREYASYPKKSHTQAEAEYWVKVSRSTANLASGMEKWLNELIQEDDLDL